jgi:outer membrane protein
MKKLSIGAFFILISLASTALADSIQGRFGVTGRLGFILPAGSEFTDSSRSRKADTDAGFIGGGGFIYGIDKNWAAELDITHSAFRAHDSLGLEESDFGSTNISMGAQYRFLNLPVKYLVPYAGAGLDILFNDFSPTNGSSGAVDTVVGVHASGGVDYFVLRQLALTGQLKGVLAPDADIRDSRGVKVGNFDPSSLSVTFGVRYFFN